MLNFFYGKNGTGKSTLGRSFKNGSAKLTWSDAPYPEDQILVYNEDFIKNNIQSYGNIPGVFTISEVNAQKKKEADEKIIAKKEKDLPLKPIMEESRKLTKNSKPQMRHILLIYGKLLMIYAADFLKHLCI